MMKTRRPTKNLDRIEGFMVSMLRASRVPGAALAVVAAGRTIFANGFGFRDLKSRKPVTPNTVYPIASTTKAINAMLLGLLVEDGKLEWDAPVQRYLPRFRLQDDALSSRVTLRDLLTMQTGLPRHDWVWIGNPISRAELVQRLAYLQATADLRQRFQYSNLAATTAGHIAEIVTGKHWESLVEQRIFRPAGMRRSGVALPEDGDFTLSYHESARRQLLLTRRLASELTAPSGGAVHSTVLDMARWITLNLSGGKLGHRQVVSTKLMSKLHAPQVIIGSRPLAGLPADAAYALGWVVHTYNGQKCLWHGGYVHDVNSSVMLFPQQNLGIVSFINFGCPVLADSINRNVFDLLMGLKPEQTIEARLEAYETQIRTTRESIAAVERVKRSRPSHALPAYRGRYEHPAYGLIEIRLRGGRLVYQRHELRLSLQHWHGDVWVAEPNAMWTIHQRHPFDGATPFQFHMNARHEVVALSIPLEPEVPAIRFEKCRGGLA